MDLFELAPGGSAIVCFRERVMETCLRIGTLGNPASAPTGMSLRIARSCVWLRLRVSSWRNGSSSITKMDEFSDSPFRVICSTFSAAVRELIHRARRRLPESQLQLIG